MQMLNISIKDKVVRGNGNLFMGHPICIYFNKNLYIHIKHYFPRQDSTGLKILVHARIWKNTPWTLSGLRRQVNNKNQVYYENFPLKTSFTDLRGSEDLRG